MQNFISIVYILLEIISIELCGSSSQTQLSLDDLLVMMFA